MTFTGACVGPIVINRIQPGEKPSSMEVAIYALKASSSCYVNVGANMISVGLGSRNTLCFGYLAHQAVHGILLPPRSHSSMAKDSVLHYDDSVNLDQP
jgi:hypothetical protein